ncbi:hypothetical protein DFH09DRAFT_1309358 [Mycena vulgaris]|nr:hypothetical protein DFH09DRAFT_1309358 [Mycena vulgaris]
MAALSSSPTTPRTNVTSYQARLAAAMLEDSPVPLPPRKRQCPGTDDEEDGDEDDLPITVPSSDAPSGIAHLGQSVACGDGNILAFAKQYATHKRLKPSQIAEITDKAQDSLATRQIKMFTLALSVDSKLDAIVTSAPEFKLSAAFEKNLRQLALGVMTSSRISSYKGPMATKHVLSIVKKNRFDLPAGIKFIVSDWGLVKSRAEYHLTQVRTGFKNMPLSSVPKNHMNIFVLAQRFVKDCNTVLTVELCARIALMKQHFILFPGDNFWDKLDQNPVWMRKNAKYDENKIAKAFKLVLNDDRAAHGNSADYALPDDAIVDTWQLFVDTSIDADGLTT